MNKRQHRLKAKSVKKWGAAIGVLFAVLVYLIACAVSWTFTCGVIKLVTLCFGWTFTWSVATGIWLLCMLVLF